MGGLDFVCVCVCLMWGFQLLRSILWMKFGSVIIEYPELERTTGIYSLWFIPKTVNSDFKSYELEDSHVVFYQSV